jgi:hypothetical protein
MGLEKLRGRQIGRWNAGKTGISRLRGNGLLLKN